VIIFYELEKNSIRKGGIPMSIKKWLTGLVVLLAMVVTTPGSPSVFAKSSVVTQPIESVKVIEVELNDDYFNPKVITIPNGRTTTLVLKNKGRKEHTFTVEKLRIDAEVQPGKEKSINVTPKKPGTYEVICRYHLQEGMVGKVIVK
jgi:plastocyanin